MNDRERIEAMRAAGTITPEEARMLLEAIGEGATEPTATATEPVLEPALDAPPAVRRWCTVVLLAGDVEVAVADVAEPELDGGEGLTLVPSDDGVRLQATGPAGFGRLGLRTLRANLRLPRDWGLALDLKAGDVGVRDVAWVRGRMLAGDLRVFGASWVDLVKLAGDIEAHLCPTEGVQRIEARAGEVSVRILPGADVHVSADVAMGDLKTGFAVVERGFGAHTERTYGSGRARLTIKLTAGDLQLSEADSEVA
jgi:hypothetical protein